MGNNILPEVEPYGSLFFLHHYKGITWLTPQMAELIELVQAYWGKMSN